MKKVLQKALEACNKNKVPILAASLLLLALNNEDIQETISTSYQEIKELIEISEFILG